MDSETTPAADDEMRHLMRTLKRLYEHTPPYNSYPDAYWMEFVTRIRDGCTDPPDPTMFLAPLARPSGEDEEAMDDGAGGDASFAAEAAKEAGEDGKACQEEGRQESRQECCNDNGNYYSIIKQQVIYPRPIVDVRWKSQASKCESVHLRPAIF